MSDSESLSEANVNRATSLRALPPLTEGLEVSADDRERVDKAIAGVEAQGYSIITDFLSSAQLEQLRTDLDPVFAESGIRDATGSGRHTGT